MLILPMLLAGLVGFAVWVVFIVCVITIAVNTSKMAGTLNRLEKKLCGKNGEQEGMKQE